MRGVNIDIGAAKQCELYILRKREVDFGRLRFGGVRETW